MVYLRPDWPSASRGKLAVEGGLKGFELSPISPGLIRTPLATELLERAIYATADYSPPPLRRVGEPEEIARRGVMLASRGGWFISGQKYSLVDGGYIISDGN